MTTDPQAVRTQGYKLQDNFYSSSSARSITMMQPLKDVTVTAGETATFECELSYEGIAVEWFLGGEKMEASDRVSPKSKECYYCCCCCY